MKWNPWPVFVIVALSSIGVLNVIVYRAASSSRVDLVEKSPYEAGLRFDETVKQRNQAAAIAVSSSVDEAGRVSLQFESSAYQLTDISVVMMHHSDRSLDQQGKCSASEQPNKFSCNLVLPVKAQWFVSVTGRVNGESALWEDRLMN